jgi:hypothetical protein
MNKTITLFIFLFTCCCFSQEQKIEATFISNEKLTADLILGSDSLGNVYFVSNEILFKKNKTEVHQYKNIALGKISHVDFLNPFRIVLFYEDFNTVIFLDNQFNEIQKINLSETLPSLAITAIGNASQNRLWIYDNLNQQISLYDYLKNTHQPITPVAMGNFLYYETQFNTFQWIDVNSNWFLCDVFGKITNKGKVSAFEQIQLLPNYGTLFYYEGKLKIQDLKKQNLYTVENIPKTFQKFYYKDQILSIFTNEGITNYKIIIPN